MRISKVLEDESRNGETKEFVFTTDRGNICFKKISEFSVNSNEELNYFLEVCKLINSNIDDCIQITSDDVDDHDDLLEMTNQIYESGDLCNPAFNDEGDVETNRLVSFGKVRLVITQSSNDFIGIIMNQRSLNIFIRQLLSNQKFY